MSVGFAERGHETLPTTDVAESVIRARGLTKRLRGGHRRAGA